MTPAEFKTKWAKVSAKELNELRERWLNPPEWTATRTLEFPGTGGGPWDRYIERQDAQDLQNSKGASANDPVHLVNPVKNQMMIFHETPDAAGFADPPALLVWADLAPVCGLNKPV